MEGKNHFIAIIAFLLLALHLVASDKTEIYQAYVDGRMDAWKKIMDNVQTVTSLTNEQLADLVNYQYGYIGWCLGNNKEEEAQHYLDLAEENLLILEGKNYNKSFISAYNSAFYGFKIGLSQIKAPFLGPKSVRNAKEAIQLNPEYPMGYIQYGNSQYYMPAVFGGSKEVAVDYYEKALALMEQNPDYLNNNWNYLNLLVILGTAYTEMENYPKAKFYFDKALKKEPNFKWVKNELYPELQKKMK